MSYNVQIANPTHARVLSDLYLMSGDGLMEFMFSDVMDVAMMPAILLDVIVDRDSELSYNNAVIALEGEKVLAASNFFSSAKHRVSEEMQEVVPRDRLAHVEPIFLARVPESMYINALSVYPEYRRQGLAKKILDEMQKVARARGFTSMSLIVWDDNVSARKLYQGYGFADVKHIDIPYHEDLPHRGGCYLMKYDV